MPLEGWVTRFLTFGFLTLDFLGAIFFWYLSLRKKIQKYQDNLREIKCWYDVFQNHTVLETYVYFFICFVLLSHTHTPKALLVYEYLLFRFPVLSFPKVTKNFTTIHNSQSALRVKEKKEPLLSLSLSLSLSLFLSRPHFLLVSLLHLYM